jgi:hypothetical protein
LFLFLPSQFNGDFSHLLSLTRSIHAKMLYQQ